MSFIIPYFGWQSRKNYFGHFVGDAGVSRPYPLSMSGLAMVRSLTPVLPRTVSSEC
jgi:hypothetical protein